MVANLLIPRRCHECTLRIAYGTRNHYAQLMKFAFLITALLISASPAMANRINFKGVNNTLSAINEANAWQMAGENFKACSALIKAQAAVERLKPGVAMHEALVAQVYSTRRLYGCI